MHNWDDYKFFLAVARAGSVSAASSILGVNQSTVSRRISAFEKAMNVRLFERLSTGFTPTEEGRALLQSATRIEDEVRSVDLSLKGKNSFLEGPIRLSVSLGLIEHLLMPLLKKFNELHPKIEIDLDISNNIANLYQREADMALRVSRSCPPDKLIGTVLGKVQLAVFGERSYLQEFRRSSGKAALRWIGEDNLDGRPNWLPDAIENLQLTMRSNDVLATLSAIRSGLGVGRLPGFLGDAYPELARFSEAETIPSVSMWLLTHTELRQVRRVTVLRDFLLHALPQELEHHG